MPCNDGYGPGHTVEYVEREHDGKMAARLCAVLSVLEHNKSLDHILNQVNWREAGVSKAGLERWWNDHKLMDQQRKARERNERERQRTKEAALKKLSPAERKALGL